MQMYGHSKYSIFKITVKSPAINRGMSREFYSVSAFLQNLSLSILIPNPIIKSMLIDVFLHPTPVLLPGKSHGRRSLVGCCRWGRTESDTSEANLAAAAAAADVFLTLESKRDSGVAVYQKLNYQIDK